MATSRIAEVNRALRARGVDAKLVRGAGYYYFTSDTLPGFPTAGIYGVQRADIMSVTEWLREFDRLAADAAPIEHDIERNAAGAIVLRMGGR